MARITEKLLGLVDEIKKSEKADWNTAWETFSPEAFWKYYQKYSEYIPAKRSFFVRIGSDLA